MTPGDWGVRLLTLMLGLFIVMRTVNTDDSGRTLVDHIMGKSGSDPTPGQNVETGAVAKTATKKQIRQAGSNAVSDLQGMLNHNAAAVTAGATPAGSTS